MFRNQESSWKLTNVLQCLWLLWLLFQKLFLGGTFARDVQELLADLEARLAAAAGPVAMDVI